MAWCALGALCLLHAALAVQVKVLMHSEQEDSRLDEEESRPRQQRDSTLQPFIERHEREQRPRSLHPNDLIFPLIYRQSHINSMFKFGENWYTWSAEKRADGSEEVNYYICYDEPKRCDDVGWERTVSVPKCAFQIESVSADDRACVTSFGVEPRAGARCDGAHQMKVSDVVRSCGPRIRSLWRFVRVGRRSPSAAKPADVNSLVCEDEEECFLTIEYRIHHDRITFSLHEPSRGQTFKSTLKREPQAEETTTEARAHARRGHKRGHGHDQHTKRGHEHDQRTKRGHARAEDIEPNESTYAARRPNKIKIREDISDDLAD